MSRNAFHSLVLAVLAVTVLGLLFVALSGETSAQQGAGVIAGGRDVVMMRCSLAAEDFSTIAIQSSAEVPAKKGVACPANVSTLTAAGFQVRFIGTSDVEKGFLVMMLTR